LTRRFSLLYITDGTTIVDLIKPAHQKGIHLVNWTPQLPQFKGGGNYQSSSLAEGQSLIGVERENITETFELSVNAWDADELIAYIRGDLLSILQKAISYNVTHWQQTPVYIVAQGVAETNPRYGLIVNYNVPQLDHNPYLEIPPEGQMSLTLTVEHEAWTQNTPGAGTAVPLLVRDSETSTSQTFVAGASTMGTLTHIYVDDGGVFGSNQVAATAFDLLPATPAVNDAIYFGNENNWSFFNLIFDLDDVWAGTSVVGVWEIYTGSWQALTDESEVEDDTNGFTTAGVNSVGFFDTGDTLSWTPTTVNSVSGLWVRFRVTASAGTTTNPTQQNRIVYTESKGYLEVAATGIAGDIPALAKLKLTNETGISVEGGDDGVIGRVIGGLRQTTRGENFNAFITLGDVQNISGITATNQPAFAYANAYGSSPTGRVLQYTISSSNQQESGSVVMVGSISAEYQGRFRCFFRAATTTGSSETTTIRLLTDSGISGSFISGGEKKATIPTSTGVGEIALVDMGVVSILENIDLDGGGADVAIWFQIETDATSGTVTLYDMILLPVDEMAFDTYASVDFLQLFEVGIDDYLEIDGIVPLQSLCRRISDDNPIDRWTMVSNGLITFQSGAKQRLWLIFANYADGFNGWEANPHRLARAQAWKNQRYQGPRGDG